MTIRYRRRTVLGGLTATSALALIPSLARRASAQAYPSRNFNVTIPTGQGGGAERLARAFDAAWGPMLGQKFEYEFYPGAGGQVGYELYVNRREPNGHNLLFGNMGPEMIMYALQEPDYNFPEDYIYFCRIDVDDSCVFVRPDSEFQSIEQVVDAAKQRTINVGTSRIPHPASIGILSLGEKTGGQFNLVPYGGGNPTYIGVLNGEVDIGVLPVAGVIARGDQFKVLAIFNKEKNPFAEYTNDAPIVNAVFGTDIPDLYSSRSWAVHTAWADANPDQFQMLQDSSAKVFDDPAFKDAYVQSGAPLEALSYGDREVCTEYALAMVELAERYRDVLSAAE